MVLMTSISGVLSGTALLVSVVDETRFGFRLQHWLGAIIFAIAAIAGLETLTDRSMGIDFSALHAALLPGYFPPGRMAPNTLVNFLMIGVALGLAGRNGTQSVIRSLSVLVFLVGATGFFAYRLELQYIFGWYATLGLVRMSLPTCVNMMLIGVGLWPGSNDRGGLEASHEEGRELRTIFVASATVLLITALATGVNAFGLMQDSIYRTTSMRLSELAQTEGTLIDESIGVSSGMAALAAGEGAVAGQMGAWNSGPAAGRWATARGSDSAAAGWLQARGAKLLEQGFSGVVYRLPDGRSIEAGRMIVSPPIRAPILGAVSGELIWQGGYYLSTSVPIIMTGRGEGRGVAGEMLAQQPMPVLDRLARRPGVEGETGALDLCTPAVPADSAHCFPMRDEGAPFSVSLLHRTALASSSLASSGLAPLAPAAQTSVALGKQPLAMAKALANESGTIMTRDSEGVPVTASYRPLRKASLGLVLKVDTVETFEPLRHSLEVALPLTILVILISLWIMQWRLKPLVDGLISSREQIRQLALHDPLTGLPNRTLMDDRLQMAFAAARRSGGFVALALVDVDGFKQVNDSLGHEAGDELLSMIADRLMESVRASDTVARLGGDEFVIILPDVLVPESVSTLAKKIVGAFCKPVDLRGLKYSIRLSIGFAVSTPGSQDGQLLMRQADAAMYAAKEGGGNRVTIHDLSATVAPDGELVAKTALEDAPGRHAILRAAIAPELFKSKG